MPILDSVRNMLTRRRTDEPAAVDADLAVAVNGDLADTQAGKLFQVLQASEQVRQATHPDPQADLARPARPAAMLESKPPHHRQPDAAMATSEVVTLVRRIGEHLDEHRAGTERMLTLLERAPAALASLPEMNRQCTRMLELASESQQQSRQRDQSLNQSLTRIGEASEKHTEVLGLLQQQLDANGAASARIAETLDSFRSVLSEMSSSTGQQVDVLSRMARASEKRELRITTTLANMQKWMIASMIFCGVVSLAALIVAVVVLAGA